MDLNFKSEKSEKLNTKSSHLHPIFQYPLMRSDIGTEKDFHNGYLARFYKHEWELTLSYPFLYLTNKLESRNKCNILFFGDKFLDIIHALKSKNFSVGIIGGYKELQTAKSLETRFYIIYKWKKILIGLFKKDPALESKKSQKAIESLGSFLKKIGVKVLVLPNDSLFLERFFIESAKRFGIKTICIQHGLFFSEKANPHFIDGHFADHMFLWGNSQKRLYKKIYSAKILDEKFKILGYPYRIENNTCEFKEKKICILGQPFEIYNYQLGLKKKLLFEKVAQTLLNKGLEVVYKPHPGEKSKDFFPSNLMIYSKDLKKAFKEFNVFLSLTSTALVEASLNKRIALQIYDPDFTAENFEQKGYSYSINSTDISKIADFISNINHPFEVKNDVIFQPHNVGERFLHLLHSLK